MAEFDVFARPSGRFSNDSQFENLNPSRIRLVLLLVVAAVLVAMMPSRMPFAKAVSAGPTPACAGAYCTITYAYTGDYYTFTAPFAGTYSLKAWGAQGGNDPAFPSTVFGGRGGYAAGDVYLSAGATVHVYVGGQGTGSTLSNWNSTGGGGATDFRLTSGAWNLSAGLLSRILVAGGGGGRHGKNYEAVTGYIGNDGGGASSPSVTVSGYTLTGSTETTGGASTYSSGVAAGSFGYANPNANSNSYSAGGWNGGARGSDNWANGGGGGGWYGGVTSWPTGAGGSGYALTSSSNKPASYSPTSSYWLTNTSLIAGNASMPNPAGGNMTGRTGNGLATITYLNVPTPTFTPSISTPSTSRSFTYSVSYSESITGLTASDFTISGTSTGWSISSLTGSGAGPYTVTMSGASATSGTVILTQTANTVLGGASGQNGPFTNTAAATLTVDYDAPTVTFSTSPSTPASAVSLTFGLTLSESVTGIAAADFSNAGTATGCVFTPSVASGSTVNVVATQCTEGTLILQVATNAFSDAAGNTGPVSVATSSTITLTGSALTVSAVNKSINYGGSWTDSYTQSGLLSSDTVTVTYTYTGTTTSGAAYGPSATKPTIGGTYSIIPAVTYTGSNANRYALTTNNATLTIARVAQSALTVSTTSGTYGIALTLGTTGGTGTGAVSYSVSNGSCFVLGSVLTLGDAGSNCSVIATKDADDNYTAVSSVATSVSTAKAAQATLSVTSTSATYGVPLTMTSAGGTGAGAVTYAVVSGTCTISSGVLTVGDVGSSCVVKASKATDVNYLALDSANTNVSIAQGTQAALSVTSLSATYGQTMSLTATGGSGTGALSYSVVSGTCSIVGTTLTPGNAGSACVIKATRAQSTNYVAIDSADATVTIARANQNALTITTTSGIYGSVLSLATSGGSGTGSVSYAVSSGSCFVLGSLLTLGDAGSSCSVVATKSADTNYNSISSSSTAVTTAKASQASLNVATTNATYGQNLSLSTSGGSGGGAVSYTVISGTCTLNGSTLTPGNAGSSCVVKATKATDTNYNELSSSNTTISIAKASQSGLNITSNSSFTTGGTLGLAASGGQSGGGLSWSLQAGYCTLTGTTLSSSRGGVTCVVEVTRAGDSNYLSSTSTATITVNKISQFLTFRSTPAASTLVGSTYTVSVDSDVSLAPTITIAGSSSSVCSIAAGVVTFNATGSCVISASQAGNDVYASAAASQSVTVVEVAATTVPGSAGSGNSSSASSSTTTIPQSAGAKAVSTTSTTSTTTTTTLPQSADGPILGSDGQPEELKAGEVTAMVRGEKVKVNIETKDGQAILKVGDKVTLKLGTTDPSAKAARVNSDGVLVAYRDYFVDVRMEGLIPGTTYTIYMFSDPIELGRGIADANGNIIQKVRVPKDVQIGSHTIQVNGVGDKGEVVSVSMGMKILKKESNTLPAIIAITIAMLLALLGGRPIFRRRRQS